MLYPKKSAPVATKQSHYIAEAFSKLVAYAENFHGGVLVQGHMVVICIWCALLVTSQFDFISMFPNQRFGEVC